MNDQVTKMRRSHRLGVWALAVCGSFCLWAGAGCGDDDGGTNENTPVDAGVDAAPDAVVGESLTLLVVDIDEMLSLDDPTVVIEGATVAVDLPGGDRVEVESDADGLVTIDGIDWSAGNLSYTAFKFGYSLLSVVDVDASFIYDPFLMIDDKPAVGLIHVEPEPIETATQRGDFTGLVDETHNVYLQPLRTAAGEEWYGVGTDVYNVPVQTGVDFTLVGFEGLYEELPSGQGRQFEIFRAMYQDFDAITANVNGVTLDFEADQATLHTADASMFLPTRADSPLRSGVPMALVYADGSVGLTGIYTYLDISADGNHFDVRLAWVEPPLLEGVWTMYQVFDEATGAYSWLRVNGYPQPGTIDPPLLDTPRLVTPANPSAGHPLHAPIEFEVFDGAIDATGLFIWAGERLMWRVFSAGTATTLTVPSAPALVNESGLLGTEVTAQVIIGSPDPVNPLFFGQLAVSPVFDIDP